MPHTHFDELQEWSERKHDLVMKYLGGFVRILGRSITGTVYYVDGFAGPGKYGDGGIGSPIKAAEFAKSLVNKDYQLRCINVEEDELLFQNLSSEIKPYEDVAACFEGRFGDHVDTIISTIGDSPTIFFLDPFGVKGIEWECLLPILERQWITEILIRINPKDLSRLAGFSGSTSPGAKRKRRILTELYGFKSSLDWEEVWHTESMDGLVALYVKRLLRSLTDCRGRAFVSNYPIRTIDGILKYYLLFGTCHPKGATLMSRNIYAREKSYERDVHEYKEQIKMSDPHRQFDMFDVIDPDPTEEELDAHIALQLASSIWEECVGLSIKRDEVEEKMLPYWFGKASGSHYTKALKKLEGDGRIAAKSGATSNPRTRFYFRSG